ncbi:hypothetical protein CDG81_11615 [Actinopolyspora erythraea]|uniref:Uncharacterized protein n=1 Tax=Actinopolyspora erythraea TaxID=414996 RepID=A0A099D5M7_9ACTN|nr:hypothetical protein CDG81_11615 [Actinopolyspora erythraea]KGI81334.1 hypothetical protein IL38_11695 [Actinopolyspora erythraea]
MNHAGAPQPLTGWKRSGELSWPGGVPPVPLRRTPWRPRGALPAFVAARAHYRTFESRGGPHRSAGHAESDFTR